MLANILVISLVALFSLIFIIIGLLFYDKYQNNIYKRNIKEWTRAVEEWLPILDFIKVKSIYLMRETYDDILASTKHLPKNFKKYKKQFSKWKYKDYIELINSMVQIDYHHNYNKIFIDKTLQDENVLELLNNIDNKSLDLRQKEVVISDERNTLVVAGAGSGKR